MVSGIHVLRAFFQGSGRSDRGLEFRVVQHTGTTPCLALNFNLSYRAHRINK